MDRRFPRIGLFSLLVAATQLFSLVFNGLLGWFPGALLGSGGWGMKFHFYTYLRQILGLPYQSDNFWSDAGSLTGQEYAMLVLLLITGVVGYIGTRERPSFEGPEKMSYEDQREALEAGAVGIARPSGLSVINPTTAAIVDSVVGGDATPTGDVITRALGEMAVVAAEMVPEDDDDSEAIPVLDSRYTVTIDSDPEPMDDGDTLGASDEEDDWADEWFSPSADRGVVASEDSGEEVVVDLTQELDSSDDALPELEVVAVVADSHTELSVPVVEPRTGPRVGAMPVRPQGLPAAAEWDIENECWVLFGRPIEMAQLPQPAPQKPEWAQKSEPAELPTVPSPPKKGLPTIPSTSKTVGMPSLPALPRRS